MSASIMTATRLDLGYDEQLIVKSLDLSLPVGKVTSIIGPNGCGKSTILKAMGRILRPSGGAVCLRGQDIRTLNTKEIARRMAILPQAPQAPGGLTVEELVAYGRYPHQKGFGKLTEEDRRVIHWALCVTNLEAYTHAVVDTLSGGQRQRVWIAVALAQQTELILLDEPTTYLDLSYQLEVLELLHRLNREQHASIVMVLHDLNLAARFSDYMIAVRNGRIVCHGDPQTVMCAQVLRDVFHIDACIQPDPRTGKPACVTYNRLPDMALNESEPSLPARERRAFG